MEPSERIDRASPDEARRLLATCCGSSAWVERMVRRRPFGSAEGLVSGARAAWADLTHTDALYFTVTVFTTVGFGDITAKSEGARLLVAGQMVTDLIIIGIGAKIILGAVTRGRRRQPHNAGVGKHGE